MPSGVTTSCWSKRPTSWAGSGSSPVASRLGRTCSTTSAWYTAELERLGVDVRCGRPADADQVVSAGADHVVIAVGAASPAAGFQRALRLEDELPGIELGRATTAQDVLAGDVVVGGRVLVLDDVDDWRGIGTAMFLQERGCTVTVATSAAAVASALAHSAADVPARRRFAGAGGELAPNTVVVRWSGDAATLRSTLTGHEVQQRFDWLVVAGTPVARTQLSAELDARGGPHLDRRLPLAAHGGGGDPRRPQGGSRDLTRGSDARPSDKPAGGR